MYFVVCIQTNRTFNYEDEFFYRTIPVTQRSLAINQDGFLTN